MKTIIFYGTDCNEKTAWIPWLNDELANRNVECIIPTLPTPQNQNFANWGGISDNLIFETDDIVVGWSTGAIFAVRYLYEKQIRIKKLILISGFNNYVGNVPFVDNLNKDFFMQDESVAQTIADEIVCIKSDNDPFITQNALESFAKNLNAKIVNIKNGGHFNSNAGYNKFVELLDEITK